MSKGKLRRMRGSICGRAVLHRLLVNDPDAYAFARDTIEEALLS